MTETDAELLARLRNFRDCGFLDEPYILRLLAIIDEKEAEVGRIRAALTLCTNQLEAIRKANDPDDADSYRSDDREGCLDWTFAAAEEAEIAARTALTTPEATNDTQGAKHD